MEISNLNDLIAFVESIKYQSYSVAAKQLGLSRSAISKRISRLEDRLGIRLLQRNSRHISLTDDGQLFYERCVNILEELEDAEQLLAQRLNEPRGKLRISVPTGLGLLVLPPIIQAYLKQYPQVEIEISLSDRYVDLVEDGFDLAVRVGIPNSESRLLARTINLQPLLLCASPDYLKQYGTPQKPDDLVNHQCLHYVQNGSISAWKFQHGGKLQTFIGKGRYRADNVQQLVSFAAAHFGVVQLFHYLVKNELEEGRLVPILTEYQIPETAIQVVYSSRKQLSPKIRSFIDYLAENWR
ncbi:LysR family transcriptional regulator [Basilea psittacipulmonis]|uniref:LysR family transcriptional regulator n=1 Tax=Basilea psittacipulmonis DSM 24701 TaxID=1072685 RepID=A0A077DH28_9BURK|nr:LysR family transcriptional regulator [Basilea psittacipulmonis]AIL32727.1 LysR family transcriptional regulator [Basilea psittacipulmonis DSM 24701]